jgi:hypothetical protein
VSFTPITVTFTFLNSDNSPANGTVSFRLTNPITDRTDVIVGDLQLVTLDANGYGSITLPANDDSTTFPVGTGYIVTEKIQNASPRTYNVILNHTQPGGTIDLSNLAPASTQVLYPTVGAQGAQGASGAQGPQGFQGSTGSQGAQGAQGTQGAQGFQGTTGAQGSQGAQGAQGTNGVQGATGNQGSQGTQGVQGTQGFQGTIGAQGLTGSQGNQGTTGPQGVQGSTGSQGAQGSTGAQGPQGSTGSQGTQGSTGAQGSQGSTGAQGPQGTTGPQGSQGNQGFQGNQGTTGANNTSWIATSGSTGYQATNTPTTALTALNITNVGNFSYYLVTASCVQTIAASNSGTRMYIGFQSSGTNIAIDGNSPTSTSPGAHRFAAVGNSNSGLQSATYSTMLAAASTTAFNLSAYVYLDATPGATPPTFAYWTLTVVGLS